MESVALAPGLIARGERMIGEASMSELSSKSSPARKGRRWGDVRAADMPPRKYVADPPFAATRGVRAGRRAQAVDDEPRCELGAVPLDSSISSSVTTISPEI